MNVANLKKKILYPKASRDDMAVAAGTTAKGGNGLEKGVASI